LKLLNVLPRLALFSYSLKKLTVLDAIRTEEMFREDAEERGEAREKAKWEDKIKKAVQKLKKSGHFTNEEIAETMGLSVSEVEML